MLLAFALILIVPPTEEPPIPTVPVDRADLVDAFRRLMAGMDGNHDGQLSRAEWDQAFAGTGGSNPKADRASPIRMSIDAPPEEVFRDLDRNNDGLVSFEEFARGPLTSFDCEDADHDGTVQPAEVEAGRTRCAAGEAPAQ